MEEEKKVACENCQRLFTEQKIDLHEAYCIRNMRKCEQCSEFVDKSEMEEHIEQEHQKKPCQYCKVELEPKYLETHEQMNCIKRPVICQFCEMTITQSEKSAHEQKCGSKTKVCNFCNKYIQIKDYETHQIMCQSEQIQKQENQKQQQFQQQEKKIQKNQINSDYIPPPKNQIPSVISQNQNSQFKSQNKFMSNNSKPINSNLQNSNQTSIIKPNISNIRSGIINNSKPKTSVISNNSKISDSNKINNINKTNNANNSYIKTSQKQDIMPNKFQAKNNNISNYNSKIPSLNQQQQVNKSSALNQQKSNKPGSIIDSKKNSQLQKQQLMKNESEFQKQQNQNLQSSNFNYGQQLEQKYNLGDNDFYNDPNQLHLDSEELAQQLLAQEQLEIEKKYGGNFQDQYSQDNQRQPQKQQLQQINRNQDNDFDYYDQQFQQDRQREEQNVYHDNKLGESFYQQNDPELQKILMQSIEEQKRKQIRKPQQNQPSSQYIPQNNQNEEWIEDPDLARIIEESKRIK